MIVVVYWSQQPVWTTFTFCAMLMHALHIVSEVQCENVIYVYSAINNHNEHLQHNSHTFYM